MDEPDFEGFRALEYIFTPDARNSGFVRIAEDGVLPFGLENHHQNISKIELNELVSRDVRNHFNNAKNLVLYSWFVYRFGSVAEHHAFVSFEFALRERLKGTFKDPSNPPGFKGLLQMAVDKGLLKNEKFTKWHIQVQQRKFQNQENKEMAEFIGYEYKPILEDVDYLAIMMESFPNIRNFYTHGTADPFVPDSFHCQMQP